VRERQEKVERNVVIIQAAKGGDITKLTGANLTVLLTWYQHANVAKMKKDKKSAAWVVIVSSRRARALVVVFHVINAYSWYSVEFSYQKIPTDKCVVGGGDNSSRP